MQKFIGELQASTQLTTSKISAMASKYAAGEYGDQTKRPHYHAIIYGLELDDLVFYKKMALESANLYYNYYNSESLQSCWRDKDGNDIGFVVVGKVTWETCAYVARYIMKKQKGQGADIYEKFNIDLLRFHCCSPKNFAISGTTHFSSSHYKILLNFLVRFRFTFSSVIIISE
jgi:hypothetical protein